jgi:ubiquinone/menaquinone biosynthesis C-methylase UbiE
MSVNTQRIRKLYDRMARKYDSRIRVPEALLFQGGREWVCSRAKGDVLEIAIGTGRNLGLYRPGVRLTGIELSNEMLTIARKRAIELRLNADLRVGDAQNLDFPNESFDTVVCTLGLCTIPDEKRTLSECRRVLRKNGRLLLLEHVRSPNRVVRAIERILEPLFLWLEGDHLTRDPLDYVETEGFLLEEIERRKLGVVERVAAIKI